MSNCVNKGCAAYKGPCLNDMPGVVCYGFMPPITNADRIRSMTDEELADILRCVPEYTDCPKGADDCRECILEWLRKEAE